MKKTPREGGWYVRKFFPHFDQPLDFASAKRRVEDDAWVAAHAFWPFLGFEDRKRRFRTVKGERKADTKSRPIKYCSHVDGYVFAYYAFCAQEAYERYIKNKAFAESVIGYRKGLGTNIDMANDAFREILRRKRAVAICLDITSFFDTVDHQILKTNLQRVLGAHRLSKSWFAVYRAMTRYAWIDAEQLQRRLGIDPAKPPRPLCSASEFRSKVRGDGGMLQNLIKTNDKKHGIPQGSPISAILSNVFMLDFDAAVHAYVSKWGGSYRRYSDDIMVICAPSFRLQVVNFVRKEIAKLGGAVTLSEEKTEISTFERKGGSVTCDRPATYLGFTFDGTRVSLRGRTLSRYYRRMSYATRHAAASARAKGSAIVFKRKLFRDFSHLGSDNFYSYARRAAKTFDNKSPTKQLRRHVRILYRKLSNGGR
ncbi:MAG: hypothetical protein EKK41_13225 [Hyphomicrobiales bacterium]|nr:MAG: hypothetical protein EKK41_13225 [Hyphomicrobiales bacterium]